MTEPIGRWSAVETIGRGVHGHNERVSVESFRLNCQMVWEVTRRMCARQ